MFQGFKDRDAAERIQRSHKVLDQYRTCDACQGRGLVKTIYNFMVLESNCNECDSEGVIKMVDNATAKETSQATTESDGSTVAVSAEALVETTANAALTVESITTFETACEDEHEEAKAEEVLMDMVD